MHNPEFHRNLGPFTLRQIADFIDAKLECNDENFLINDFNSTDKASKLDITFLVNDFYDNINLIESKTFIVSNSNRISSNTGRNILRVENVHLAVAKLSNKFFDSYSENLISSLKPAFFNRECKLLDNSAIISNGSIFGKNANIKSGVYVGHNCVFGDNVTIGNNTIITNSIIGDNVKIGRNCSIGQPGFGFAINSPSNENIFHKGRVIMQNNVQVGSNCCIDRGSFKDTIIGENTYMDNMCHIAHNVQIGRNCVFAGCLGVAGSAKIGDFVFTGGQVGIAGHINIGDRVKIAAQSGVFSSVDNDENLMGSPAINRFKYIKNFKKNDRSKPN